MDEKPTPEETAGWQRRLASQANNRAWTLAEATLRTPDQDEEMLQAAHAAMYFWKIVGNENALAHAAQLVAHVYALLGLPGPASHFMAKAKPFFLSGKAEAWEVALGHAVAANVAAAQKDAEAHREHYAKAFELVAALTDPEERKTLEATLRILPVPSHQGSNDTP
jgi:hypothetical protein